jgi:Pyridoxamine 5'-phosphate oxidase like
MSGYLPLPFIEEKIKDLEYALFFSMSEAVLKIPACVVKVLETDQIGQLWFVIPRPSQFIHAFDKTFPVKLDFFRKGRDYYLKILGKAFLVNDPEEVNTIECLNESIKQQARKNAMVIVKVKISHAEYVEKAPVKPSAKSLIAEVKNRVYSWFRQSQSLSNMGYKKIPADIKYPSLSSYTN